MKLFSFFESISEMISGLIWRWSYQHRTRYSTRLATVQVWTERRY
jgi:hypothetical protein